MHTNPIFIQHGEYITQRENTEAYKHIAKYTGFSTEMANLFEALRNPANSNLKKVAGDENLKKKSVSLIENINEFISNAPRSDKGFWVYRGLSVMPKTTTRGGITLIDFGLMSTSLLPDIAKGFMGGAYCCFLAIYIPKGAPFLYIGSHSKAPYEHEVLLPFGAAFRVIKTTHRGSVLVYEPTFGPIGSAGLSKGRVELFSKKLSKKQQIILEAQREQQLRLEAILAQKKQKKLRANKFGQQQIWSRIARSRSGWGRVTVGKFYNIYKRTQHANR